MSTRVATVIDIAPPSVVDAAPAWTLPDRGKVAMASLIIAESAIFTIFVVAYLFYIGKSISGPTPRDVLETPIFYTICLLSSSFTIHYAGKVLERGRQRTFLGLWLVTVALGGSFLFGTAQEWHRLIYEHGLTISTNLFGTTYYSLVGLHAFHVSAGLVMLGTVSILAAIGRFGLSQIARVEVILMYWHFVAGVWVVVFTVVYVTGPGGEETTKIEVPAPTAWPIVLAFGCTLLFAGLLTSASVSALGALLAAAGCVGWFQDVFPHERETAVAIV